MLLRIGIMVADKDYQERIVSFLRQKNGIHVVTDPTVTADFWLVDHLDHGLSGGERIILMAKEDSAEAVNWQGERMDPYQPGSRMLRALKQFGTHDGKENVESTRIEEQPAAFPQRQERIITVYSPIGGNWKTSVAVSLCDRLAALNPERKVLYLNLEGVSAWPLYFKDERNFDLSDFIFCMLMDEISKEQGRQFLEELAVHQDNGVYTIRPCGSFEDLCELEAFEIDQLIDHLLNSFDYVVCDMNSTLPDVYKQFMLRSHKILLLTGADGEGMVKMQEYEKKLKRDHLDQLNLADKVIARHKPLTDPKLRKQEIGKELSFQPDWYQEKDGHRWIRPNTEWIMQIEALAREV